MEDKHKTNNLIQNIFYYKN